MASLAVATQATSVGYSMSLLAASIKHLNTSGLKRDPSLLCNLTAFSVFIKSLCQKMPIYGCPNSTSSQLCDAM